jgi:SAM-dependent methyltransferase
VTAPAPLGTIRDEIEIVEAAFARAARRTPRLRILEAGCGRRWLVDLKGAPHEITGVDLDARALAHRRDVVGDLQHAVHGDLATVAFAPGSFDVIYSSYVLEHVRDAAGVLDRFVSWLTPGGLLVLKIPDRGSVVGWLTRLLPFWLHVAFYRYVAEDRAAGTPGHAPYPVFHEPVISLQGIREFCARARLRIRAERGMDFGYHYRHLRLTPFQRLKLLTVETLIRVVGLLSLGTLAWRYSGLLFIIEKPE